MFGWQVRGHWDRSGQLIKAETHGIHLSSTNFLTTSRVFFALSLTLLAACASISDEEGGAEVCIRTYDDGDFVRHNCKYLTSKVRDKEGRINCTAIKVLFGN
jgi:hypothetical protein